MRTSARVALASAVLFAQTATSVLADTATINSSWSSPQKTMVPNIPTPAGTLGTTFTSYSNNYNYTLLPFTVDATGTYTATSTTTNVTNTTWFLTGLFSPSASPTTPSTSISNFFAGVFAGSSAPYTSTFSGLSLTAGTTYSVLVAFNIGGTIAADGLTLVINGPGCIAISTKTCVVAPPPPPPPPSVIDTSQPSFTNTDSAVQASTVTFDGGTLRPGSALSINRAILVTANNGVIDPNGTIVNLSGAIGGTGRLVVAGSGDLVVTGSVTNTGGLDVQNGTLTVGAGGAVAAPVTVQGGKFVLDNNAQLTSALTLNGSGSASLNGRVTAPVAVSGGGTVTVGSTGILAGTLGVTNGSATIAGTTMAAVTVGTGGSVALTPDGAISGPLALGNGGTASVSGVVSGNVGVGTGSTLVVTDGGRVTGPTLAVSGGTANLGGTVSAPVSVSNGGTARVSGVVSGTVGVGTGSTLIVTGGGRVTGGTVSVAGGTSTVDGSVSAPVTVSDGGAIAVSPNGVINAPLTVNSGSTATIDGSAMSAVSVSNATLTVGSSGSAGAVSVTDGGTATINGTVIGAADIGVGSTLSGSGRILGATTVAGTLSPGNSPGVLPIGGPVTLTSTSDLRVDIDGTTAGNGAGHHDQLVVQAGSFTAGGTLTPVFRGITGSATNSYTATVGQSFTIVTASGGVLGRFNGLARPGEGLPADTRLDVLYDATDIRLIVTPVNYSAYAGTPNQRGVAVAVDALRPAAGVRIPDAMAPLFSGLYTLDRGGIGSALHQLPGELHADTLMADLSNRRLFGQAVSNRQAALRGDAVSSGGLSLTGDSGGATAVGMADDRRPATGTGGVWGQPLAAYETISSDGNAAGTSERVGGFVAGADYALQDRFSAGVALGYVHNRTSVQDGLGKAGIDSYQATVYGSWNVLGASGPYVEGALGYGYAHYDTDRPLSFGEFRQTATGKAIGNDLSAELAAGHRIAVSERTWVEPRAGMRFDRLTRRSFSEEGGSAALGVGAAAWTTVQSQIGLRNGTELRVGGRSFQPEASLAWVHDFAGASASSTNRLANTAFTVESSRLGRDAAQIGFATNVNLDDRFSAGLSVQDEVRVRANTVSVGAGLKWKL